MSFRPVPLLRQLTTIVAAFGLGLSFASAQVQLKLPGNPDEMDKIMRQSALPCTTCGVVTNVRQVGAASVGGRDEESDPRFAGSTTSGSEVKPTTLFDSRLSQAEQRATRNPSGPGSAWQVTVRYDDGSYAAFRQDDQPIVVKGDSVRVVDGRVEPR